MSDERQSGGQSGGVSVSVAGDIVSHDPLIRSVIPQAELDEAFKSAAQAVGQHPEARLKLEELKAEAGKGNDANDGVMARLIKTIAELSPGAVTAVAGAFANPVLGGIAGPVTKYVLAEIQGE